MGHIQLSRFVRYYLGKRYVQLILCAICVIFPLIHILQTGLFLLDHFSEDDARNDMIKLDMLAWQSQMPNQSTHSKIPRIIHQIWISPRPTNEMVERFRIAANSCIEMHQNYKYYLWTNDEIFNWLTTNYAWFLPTYRSYRYDMQRIDAMKYLVLFHFGGLYIDLDIKCNAPDLITSMLPSDKLDNEPDIIFHMGTEGISANTDLVAAKRFHPFFKLAVHQLKAANRWYYSYHFTIVLSAGPTFLYGVYRQFPLKDRIYYVPNSVIYGKLLEGVGGGTWYGKDSLLLIKITSNKFTSFFLVCLCISICIFVFKLKRKY